MIHKAATLLKIYELANKYGLITNNPTIESIPTEKYPTKAERPKYSVFSKEKVIKTFNITVRNWEDALAEYLSHYKI